MSRTPQIVAAVVSLVAVASPGEASPAPKAGVTPPATTVERPVISDAARAQVLDQHELNQQLAQAKSKHMFRETSEYKEWHHRLKKFISRQKTIIRKKTSDAENLPIDTDVVAAFKAIKPIA